MVPRIRKCPRVKKESKRTGFGGGEGGMEIKRTSKEALEANPDNLIHCRKRLIRNSSSHEMNGAP